MVIAPAAFAVNTPPVIREVSTPSSTIAPAEDRSTDPVPALIVSIAVISPEVVVKEILLFFPVTTSVAVITPADWAVMVPSTVSTFAKVKAPAPASTIAPAWVEDTSTLLFAANSIDPRVSVVFVAKLPPISPCAVNLMVLVPEVKSTALSSFISLIEPVVASKVRLVSEVIFPMVILPAEEVRLATNVSSLPASAAST